MANISVIGNDLMIYRAFATLANAAPGRAAFEAHRNYMIDYGGGTVAGAKAAYLGALNEIFAGVSDLDLGTLMLANLGLSSVFTNDQAASYLAASGADRIGAVLNLATGLSLYNGTDAALVAARDAYVNKIDFAIDYSQDHADASLFPNTFDFSTFVLTTGADLLIGTSGADLFQAYLSGRNTLGTADNLQGGSGADTLFADLLDTGVSESYVSSSIETVKFRAQERSTDATDNNMVLTGESQVDAQRMRDVTWWESNNSRADLIIEDVRINANQITKDITIAMVETDPGHVDYGVYFDQLSLRNQTATTSTLALELLDTRSQVAGTGPLKDNPYNGFGFLLNGQAVVIQADGIDNALTYADLRTAIEGRLNELKATNPALNNFTVTLGSTFNRFDTDSGTLVQGTTILLNDTAGGVITLNPAVGWVTATGTVPPSSGLHTNISNASSSSTDLVTSKIVLDDVGRGSTGGDLVVGGLSTGDTSTSKGVQRFEIEVRDNSKLQTINSTNNTLQEVTIVNGATTSVSNAYTTTVTNSGYLVVNGTVGAEVGVNEALPGTETNGDQHNTYGFSDVRLIDGSAMTGKLEFTAEISELSKAKYLNLVDTASNPAADNIAFVYSGGSAADKMVVDIDSAVASSTNTLGAREDFTFTINGGAGNDSLSVTIDGAGDAWYQNQRDLDNVSINGGEGNDTIRKPGSGDVKIDAGAGNDTVYSDNSGATKAKWLVGADTAAAANIDVATLVGNTDYSTKLFMYDGRLTVTYSGPTSLDFAGGVTAAAAAAGTVGWEKKVNIPTGDNFAVDQYYINQAIKDAINNDAILSKVLKAEDGPTNTLVISALVDGAHLNTDLLIEVASGKADLADYNATEEAAIVAAYQKFTKDSTMTIVDANTAQNDGVVGSVVAVNGYAGMSVNQLFAQTALADITGADSTALTDNTINLGAGFDVLVLSTSNSQVLAADASNETVVFTATSGIDANIINFDDSILSGSVNGLDRLDFRTYLTNLESASGSTASQRRIATNIDGDANAEGNEVVVFGAAAMAFDDTVAAETFAGLTAAKLLDALNGGTAYAAIADGDLDATLAGVFNPDLVGSTAEALLLVENNQNEGEYAMFKLTWNASATGDADFETASLIGLVDFGASVDFTVAGLLV